MLGTLFAIRKTLDMYSQGTVNCGSVNCPEYSVGVVHTTMEPCSPWAKLSNDEVLMQQQWAAFNGDVAAFEHISTIIRDKCT